jgi:DNA polymerase delta subunit 1
MVRCPSNFLDEEHEKRGKPVLRMFGITAGGSSVCVFIHNFLPYFYVKMPLGFNKINMEEFRGFLAGRLMNSTGSNYRQDEIIQKIEIEHKTNIFHYSDKIEQFLKITLIAPKLVSALREMFEHGLNYNGFEFEHMSFESKVNFPLRYMIDRGIVGMSWLTLPKGKYKLRRSKITNCQIEAEIGYLDIISHAPEGEYAKIAPLRILSIDIECAAPKGRFPSAQMDPVIQIANICMEFGNPEPIIQKLFTFRSCASIVGTDIHSFEQEEKMLEEWRDFIIDLDPDIITGYNINGFDIPYLVQRAEKLKVQDFNKLSRMRNSQSKVKHSVAKSKGFKNRDFTDVNIDGRVLLDMFIYIMREYKLRSFSLNNVSFTLLGEQKEDVHHSMIYDLWNTDEYTRRRLGVYCMKDAYLPLKLSEKLMTLFNYSEMCRVTCTPLNFILTRGQQIKVSSQLHRKALEKGYIIPHIKVQGGDSDEEGYEGAFVLDPVTGFHQQPIVTLDFASLYPSIMMAHNLCYSTLIPSGKEKDMNPDDYYRTPTGDCFVREHIRKGILPIILEELISARKKAKEDIKKATDPFAKAVLDGRQLALKISANSVYGFTGAQVGQLPCLNISSSTTAIGRTMIEKTRDLVIQKFTIDNGYKYNSEVIYGDTDSVMIKFGVPTLPEAMELGKEAADFVSTNFKRPIKIEFEKVYFPYLLMKKKKYAGVIWTRLDKYDKIDTKGLEAVRRDNCELVRDMVEVILKKILLDRSVDDAVNYCKGLISDLLQNKIDISLLIISKSLSKKSGTGDDGGKKGNKKNTYVAKQAHVELAEKMKKRDEGKSTH